MNIEPRRFSSLEEKTKVQLAVLRAKGSKMQIATVIGTIGGLLVLPEFAQAIGAGGVFAIAIENLLKARSR